MNLQHYLLLLAGMMLPTQINHASSSPMIPHIVEEMRAVNIVIPEKPLAHQSLQITTSPHKRYEEWNKQVRSDTYTSLQKIVSVWNASGIAEQYLVYGKQESDQPSFSWEAIPYSKTDNTIGRLWQQFLVLWRITFGGGSDSETTKQKQRDEYKRSFQEYSSSPPQIAQITDQVTSGNDAFCQSDVIEKQQVLEGRTTRVLYNYAPIGFGGERLHFLLVPKAHKPKFSDLSREEYLEATEFAQKIMTHFSHSREIQSVYLFHKTGAEAGQTVPHWHMHMILTSNKAQNVFGKMTVLKNMLFGSSPMNDHELKERVKKLHSELEYLE